jgi:hypothetical protein
MNGYADWFIGILGQQRPGIDRRVERTSAQRQRRRDVATINKLLIMQDIVSTKKGPFVSGFCIRSKPL